MFELRISYNSQTTILMRVVHVHAIHTRANESHDGANSIWSADDFLSVPMSHSAGQMAAAAVADSDLVADRVRPNPDRDRGPLRRWPPPPPRLIVPGRTLNR